MSQKVIEEGVKILNDTKFMDINDEHGFVPLLKLCGDDLAYNNQSWTSPILTNN